jgi:hypothetical protein
MATTTSGSKKAILSCPVMPVMVVDYNLLIYGTAELEGHHVWQEGAGDHFWEVYELGGPVPVCISHAIAENSISANNNGL